MRSRALTAALLLLLSPLSVAAETVTLEAGRDNTLIEDPAGSLSNGMGPAFFVGRTNQPQNGIRRALVYFDVAAELPRNAIIESVVLTLHLAPSNPEVRRIRLHRVLADWGEGASAAGGGMGAPAQAGDATWLHTFYDTDRWARPGGQAVARPSAAQDVGDTGFYTWGSTRQMVQDVRLWNAIPARNFGWALTGDETERQTSKGFDSRDAPDASVRPTLTITYRVPGRP